VQYRQALPCLPPAWVVPSCDPTGAQAWRGGVLSTPSITGRVDTSRAWARDTSIRNMAFPSAYALGPSQDLRSSAPLTLLYPSLCRMSSPSNRRAAPCPAVLWAVVLRTLTGVWDEDGEPSLGAQPEQQVGSLMVGLP
jgi:hypothetical protein